MAKQLTEFEQEVVKTLRAIALQGGNLPDDRLTSKTGPNDAVARGQMYVNCRTLANNLLRRHGLLDDADRPLEEIPRSSIRRDPPVQGPAPDKEMEYEYMGQPVKVTNINPYPSTDGAVTVVKYEVTIEDRFGRTETLEFEKLSPQKITLKSKRR